MRPEALRHPPGSQAGAATAPAGAVPGQVSQQWQAALERERQAPADGAAAAGAAGAAAQAAADPLAGAAGAYRVAAPALQPRVGWRDASPSATWLAPVRPRAPAGSRAEPTAAAHTVSEAPAATAGGSGDAAAATADGGPAGMAPQPAATLATGQGVAAGGPGAVGRLVFAPGQARSAGHAIVAFGATTGTGLAQGSLVTAAREAGLPPQAQAAPTRQPLPQAGAQGLAAHSVARPSRPGPAFAPTHLHIGPGEDGPALWLRDAAGGTDAAAVQRLLQAMAVLGWPREWRPAAMYLNGRQLWTATAAPPPAADLPAPPAAQSEAGPAPTLHHLIKEQPHGH
jgi:hypothetical protein